VFLYHTIVNSEEWKPQGIAAEATAMYRAGFHNKKCECSQVNIFESNLLGILKKILDEH
jgi:hypothetical protein